MNKTAEVDYSLIKIISLGIISVILAFLFGSTLNKFLLSSNFLLLIIISVIMIFFLSLYLLQVLFIKSLFLFGLISLGEVLAIIISFFTIFSFDILIISSVVLFILLLSNYLQGSKNLKQVLKINFFSIGQPIVRRASTALAIFAIILCINFLNAQFQDSLGSKKIIKRLMNPVQSFILQISPQFATQAQMLPPDYLVDYSVDFINQGVLGNFRSASSFYQNLVLIGIGIFVFLTIKVPLFILIFLALLVTFIIYQLLRAFNFFTIISETRAKEIIIVE